jgi:hypothetical protein
MVFPFADYYDGSVALPDFQRHLPWASLGIFHLAALRIAIAGIPV